VFVTCTNDRANLDRTYGTVIAAAQTIKVNVAARSSAWALLEAISGSHS
jgi:hypothetical protein